MSSTSVCLDSDLNAKLGMLAKELDRSKGWIIIEALHECIDQVAEQKARWEQTGDSSSSLLKTRASQ